MDELKFKPTKEIPKDAAIADIWGQVHIIKSQLKVVLITQAQILSAIKNIPIEQALKGINHQLDLQAAEFLSRHGELED